MSSSLHIPASEVSSPPQASAAEAAAPVEVCRKLRTKMAFLPLRNADGEPVHWQKGDASTAVYWCLSTMECAGPDGGLCHATLCSRERACYLPDLDALADLAATS